MEGDHPARQRGNQMANYKFSNDELRVLQECNSESFYQRSVPIGTGLGLMTYFGINNGYLQPHTKFGAFPKVTLAVVVGYFIGKFSYQNKCLEKIMKLPNSKLAEMLRQRKQGKMDVGITEDGGFSISPFTPNVPDIYSDEGARRSGSLDLDIDSRPPMPGLDDSYRPSVDRTPPRSDNDEMDSLKPGTNYDDLRKRNREKYKGDIGTKPQSFSPGLIYDTNEDTLGAETKSPSQGNKYGDIWTN